MAKVIGRPKLKADVRKDSLLRVRVSEKELDTIKRMAKAQGVTVTGLVRERVLKGEHAEQ
ncbi:MAG TPA: hypothetical protein PLR63_08120 [Paludibacteraceae bacterium]|jgi:predicted DNA binding CopG/RHH family protein|nr:hypothetical protein [Paludibacteraceae bacterium]